MTTENTELTVQDRAAVALGSSRAETELTELAAKSKSITEITNKDGRTECHAAAMVAKDARVTIEKAGKAAREDATAFSKAVIAEEQRLVGLIAPEERRLINLRDNWDAKVKAEKEAAEAAELSRIAAIKENIAEFSSLISDAAMQNAAGAQCVLDTAIAIEIDDSFGEFYGAAVEAKADSIAKMREIVAAKTAAEALAAKVKAEQEAEAARLASEAQRLAAERAEMDRIAAEQRAAEAKRQAEERARLDAERAELDRQRREIEAAQAEQARGAAEKAAAEKAEQERIAAEERRAAQDKAAVDALAALPKVEQAAPTIEQEIHAVAPEPVANAIAPTLKLGEINARLGYTVIAEFLASLGFVATTDRAEKLYRESDFPTICRRIADHTLALAFRKAA
jgi:hypothetical protein